MGVTSTCAGGIETGMTRRGAMGHGQQRASDALRCAARPRVFLCHQQQQQQRRAVEPAEHRWMSSVPDENEVHALVADLAAVRTCAVCRRTSASAPPRCHCHAPHCTARRQSDPIDRRPRIHSTPLHSRSQNHSDSDPSLLTGAPPWLAHSGSQQQSQRRQQHRQHQWRWLRRKRKPRRRRCSASPCRWAAVQVQVQAQARRRRRK